MLSHSNACKCSLFYRISEIIIQHVSHSLYMYYEILNARFVDTSSFLGEEMIQTALSTNLTVFFNVITYNMFSLIAVLLLLWDQGRFRK